MSDSNHIDSTDLEDEFGVEYETVRDHTSNAGRQYEFTGTDGDEVGLMRERYTNIANNPTVHVIDDFEIVESETEFAADDVSVDDLDYFRGEIREFINRVLFRGDISPHIETSISIPRSNHVQIEEHSEGDVITVKFDVED